MTAARIRAALASYESTGYCFRYAELPEAAGTTADDPVWRAAFLKAFLKHLEAAENKKRNEDVLRSGRDLTKQFSYICKDITFADKQFFAELDPAIISRIFTLFASHPRDLKSTNLYRVYDAVLFSGSKPHIAAMLDAVADVVKNAKNPQGKAESLIYEFSRRAGILRNVVTDSFTVPAIQIPEVISGDWEYKFTRDVDQVYQSLSLITAKPQLQAALEDLRARGLPTIFLPAALIGARQPFAIFFGPLGRIHTRGLIPGVPHRDEDYKELCLEEKILKMLRNNEHDAYRSLILPKIAKDLGGIIAAGTQMPSVQKIADLMRSNAGASHTKLYNTVRRCLP